MEGGKKIFKYPSRHFLAEMREIVDEEEIVVFVEKGWRSRLLKKGIENWPKSAAELDKLKTGGKRLQNHYVLSQCLLFRFHFMYTWALSKGRVMSCHFTDDGIEIRYSPKGKVEPSENLYGDSIREEW